ncbi:MAG: hypothetical protein C0470_05665 [Verminephrobacter sp.]|nr:hypothetical protein [Verminephrobacter sp.]
MMAVDVDRLSRPERLLWGHGVRRPEHIDLEAIAGARGAHVIYRKLDGCAARLVTLNAPSKLMLSTFFHSAGE